jgi:uncharacterized protein (DUF488 family)
MTRLLTLGHGTAPAEELAALLDGAGVERLVDVRTAPGSRRLPHVRREAMAGWLGTAGIAYRWEPELGGFRKPDPTSVNTALRHPAFRGYADYMRTPPFWAALDRLLAEAAEAPTAAMCSETLWWRCHRRLIADAAVLLWRASVWHLGHDGRLAAHQLTPEARRGDSGCLVYDGG